MAQQICVVPERCMRCGRVYDLAYDLHESGAEGLARALLSRVGQKQKLCWHCRK